MNLTWEVEPGRVRVAEITRVVDHADCQIVEVDCNTKYAQIVAYGGGGPDRLTVMLDVTGESLRPDPVLTTPTMITFRFPAYVDADDWWIVGNLARYTAHIVMYRPTYGTT